MGAIENYSDPLLNRVQQLYFFNVSHDNVSTHSTHFKWRFVQRKIEKSDTYISHLHNNADIICQCPQSDNQHIPTLIEAKNDIIRKSLGKECNKQPLQLLYPLFENDYPYSPFK